jgi:hypothetical protein
VQPAAGDPVDQWASLVWAATVDHVLDRLSDERGGLAIDFPDLVQPVPDVGVEYQRPIGPWEAI